eukprot:2335290-Rhodomonas_salina.1
MASLQQRMKSLLKLREDVRKKVELQEREREEERRQQEAERKETPTPNVVRRIEADETESDSSVSEEAALPDLVALRAIL